jgi:hypothetical protein
MMFTYNWKSTKKSAIKAISYLLILLDHLTNYKFTVDKNLANSKYIIHNFQITINKDPKSFSPYEFSRKTNKVNNVHNHRFYHDHPQYNTHSLYEYKIPKVPILQSYTIPSQKKLSKKLCSNNFYFIFFMENFRGYKNIFVYVMGNNTK